MIVKKLKTANYYDFRQKFGAEVDNYLPKSMLEDSSFGLSELEIDYHIYMRNDIFVENQTKLKRIIESHAGSRVFFYNNTAIIIVSEEELELTEFNSEDIDYARIDIDEQITIDMATDLKSVQTIMEKVKRLINDRFLSQGVFIVDKTTTYISPNVDIKEGVVIKPMTMISDGSVILENAVIGPNVTILNSKIGRGSRVEDNSKIQNSKLADDVTVKNSTILQSTVKSHTKIGPYAYLRPNCQIGENVKIGDFVEVKNSTIGNGSKASHLTYIGDSDVGERVNIGCGVVFVNYDGQNKYRSVVGNDCFIGCNVNIVSPVNVGDESFIAAGSTITEDIDDKGFAIARSRQTNKKGWSLKKNKE